MTQFQTEHIKALATSGEHNECRVSPISITQKSASATGLLRLYRVHTLVCLAGIHLTESETNLRVPLQLEGVLRM